MYFVHLNPDHPYHHPYHHFTIITNTLILILPSPSHLTITHHHPYILPSSLHLTITLTSYHHPYTSPSPLHLTNTLTPYHHPYTLPSPLHLTITLTPHHHPYILPSPLHPTITLHFFSLCQSAQGTLEELSASLGATQKKVERVVEYFCEDCKKTKLEEVLSQLLNFVKQLNAAMEVSVCVCVCVCVCACVCVCSCVVDVCECMCTCAFSLHNQAACVYLILSIIVKGTSCGKTTYERCGDPTVY